MLLNTIEVIKNESCFVRVLKCLYLCVEYINIQMGLRSDKKNTYKPRQAGGRRLTVKEEDTLLPFLYKSLEKEHSRTAVKSLLSKGQVSVNGETTTQFDTPLSPNSLVQITYGKGKVVLSHPMLKVVWEDESLIVVNKKQGLLSVSNPKVKEKTAYHLLSDYVKKTDSRNKIFILHRLEREASGLMVFAKNKGVQTQLHANWNVMVTNRSYAVAVEGRPERDTDLLTSYNSIGERQTTYITSADSGTESIMRYRLLKTNNLYSLMELTIESGHRNLIREQMESLGTPVAGDEKYGAKTNPLGRIALHANKLFFVHPVTNKEMRFEIPIPSSFITLVKK